MQGLLLINKPKGKTSFAVVSAVKRIASEKRVGHTGTLDPMATGVLPVLIGRPTALSSLMLDAKKRYTAKIKLGITTDTEDITGEVLTKKTVNVTIEELREALNHFKGAIFQRPPMYSALKKDGVRLYDLARKGETVEIPERQIEIFEIKLISPLEDDTFSIDVEVSKGTYIRSIARDIGEFLGCGATLCELERTFAAGFDIADCVDLDSLNTENLTDYLLNEEKAVEHLREVSVTYAQATRFCNGGQLDFERLKTQDFAENELVRVNFQDQFLGIGSADKENNRLAIKCIINYPKAVQK